MTVDPIQHVAGIIHDHLYAISLTDDEAWNYIVQTNDTTGWTFETEGGGVNSVMRRQGVKLPADDLRKAFDMALRWLDGNFEEE